MSGENDKVHKALATRPNNTRYEVGYKKPPVHTRFRPGQSGNPRGRPKGAKNKQMPGLHEERLKSIILEEAYRKISVTEADRKVSIPIAQAVVRSLAVNAARGDQRAQRLFTDMVTATEAANKKLYEELIDTAINYKVHWERELERRKRLGIEAEDPIPHPDHVVIDMSTGEVCFTGPMTKEEKERWDMFRERKRESEREIAEMEKLLRDEPDYPYRDRVLEDIEHEKKIWEICARVVPD